MTNTHKKHFSAYLAFIEHDLGCKLFDWQKDVLLHIYNGELGHLCFARQQGITMLDIATVILCDAMNRDVGNLPHYMYELDGYSADAVMCDENWRENMKWKKES